MKTLKDFEYKEWHCQDDVESEIDIARTKELRKEAIKWAKDLMLDVSMVCAWAWDNFEKDAEKKLIVIKWIMHFFNLTEEDLK